MNPKALLVRGIIVIGFTVSALSIFPPTIYGFLLGAALILVGFVVEEDGIGDPIGHPGFQ